MRVLVSCVVWLVASLTTLLQPLPVFAQDGHSNCGDAGAMHQWRTRPGRTTPTALEKYFQAIPDAAQRQQAIELRLGEWAKQNPAATIRWAGEILDEGLQATVARYLVPLVFEPKPALTANFVYSLASESVRTELLTGLLRSWVNNDFQSALTWTEQLPPGRFKEEALIHMAYRWFEIDPSDAMNYASALGSCSPQLLSTLTGQWATLDPHSAAEWAANLSDSENRRRSLPAIVAVWAQQDPSDAAAFVASLPPDAAADESMMSLVSAWAGSDPEAASTWTDQIPESVVRERAMQQIATVWAQSNVQAAAGWLQSQPSGDSHDAAIVSYSSVLLPTSPADAFEWAGQIQDDAVRRRQLEFLGASWLKTNPADAERAILQSTLPNKRKQRMLNAARRDVSRDRQ